MSEMRVECRQSREFELFCHLNVDKVCMCLCVCDCVCVRARARSASIAEALRLCFKKQTKKRHGRAVETLFLNEGVCAREKD